MQNQSCQKHQSLKCTSAVSGAPCTIDGTDTNPRPEVPSLSTENLSPIEGSESDTWRCELQAACHVMLRQIKAQKRCWLDHLTGCSGDALAATSSDRSTCTVQEASSTKAQKRQTMQRSGWYAACTTEASGQ